MKRSIGIITKAVLIFYLPLAAFDVIGATSEWTPITTISKLQIGSSGHAIIYLNDESVTTNPAGCGIAYPYYLDEAKSNFSTYFNVLFAAHQAQSSVRVQISGTSCLSNHTEIIRVESRAD